MPYSSWLCTVYKYLYKSFSMAEFSFFCLIFSTVVNSPYRDLRILGVSNHLNSPLNSGAVEIILILANPPFFRTIPLPTLVIPFTLVLLATDLVVLLLFRCSRNDSIDYIREIRLMTDHEYRRF